ncbi:MAG: hypothetical protein ACOZQL_39275 [Myxococcota bacterium]
MSEELSDIELVREAGGEIPTWLKRAPLFLVVPSLLLGGGAVLDAWVSPLHQIAPAVVGVLKGVGWGLYFRFAMRSAGGVEGSGLGTPVVMMVLGFVGLEYGDLGVLAPIVVWLLPLIDYAVLYGEGPDVALGGVLDTLKAAPLLWLGSMFALLVALVMLGLVLSLPMSIYSTYAHREGAWLANLSGGLLVGPFVHVAVLFRARLFLAIHGDPA